MAKIQRIKAVFGAMILFVTALLMAGCGEHGHENHDEARGGAHGHGEGAHNESVSFKEGKGLLVARETARHIGLRVQDVVEQTITETVRFSAEVYRTAAEARLASLEGGTPVVSLASALLSAPGAEQLKRGLAVAVNTDSGVLNGRITEVHAVGQQREVLVAITDPERKLAVGTQVTIAAEVGVEKTITVIPAAALLRTLEGTFVYTVSGDRYVRTLVKAGIQTNDFVEIVDGLYAGDSVVVHPVMTMWLAELQAIRSGKACGDGD